MKKPKLDRIADFMTKKELRQLPQSMSELEEFSDVEDFVLEKLKKGEIDYE